MADNDQNQNLEEDLEEYGVWVKAGPEDVDENEGESLFGLADLDEDVDDSDEEAGEAPGFDEETMLTSEEEDLLADLEESATDSESVESLDLDEEDLSVEGLDLPESSFDEDLEDLSLDGESEEEDASGIEEMSIDSLDSLIEDEGLDVESIPGGEQDDFDEISFEEDTGTTEELPELAFDEEQPELEVESETVELELEEPDAGSEMAESLDLDTEGGDAEIELEGESLPAPESLGEDFDDIAAVEASMSEPTSSSEPQPGATPDGRVLATIEEELASIKSELHQLRSELASYRSQEGHAAPPREPAAEGEEPEDLSGFFDEDEDETIALTGDELDNILNTAEFTEEAGKPSEYDDVDLSTDFEDSDILGEGEDLIPEGMEIAEPGEPALEEGPAPVETAESQPDESPIEEITLEDIESGSAPDEDLSLDDLDVPDLDLPEEQDVDENESEVASLAEMDIESELADIDELRDEPEVAVEEVAVEVEEPEEEDSIELDLSAVEEGVPTEPADLSEAEPVDTEESADLPADLKGEIRAVLSYMDQLLEALPEDKIEEFARSEHFEVYKRLFEELGLEQG